MYLWDGGLAVTGPVRDIGQNVLRSAFVTGSGSSSSSYCHVFLLIAVLEEAFIRYIIIIPCINCIIVELQYSLFVCLFSCRYNPLWLYFHSPVAGFSLHVFEVSSSHITTRHSR
jgi:hypothetical protein